MIQENVAERHARRANEEFEGIGKLYHARFGRLRPGKDDPLQDSMEKDNCRQFADWMKYQALGDAIFRIIELERQLQIAQAGLDEEPPDPDGECFRGGEYAAYLAEQQEAARRLK